MHHVSELHYLIPRTWEVQPIYGGLRLVAPRATHAEEILQGAKQSFRNAAARLGVDLWICSGDQDQPIEHIPGSNRRLALGVEVPTSLELQNASDAELMVAIANSPVSACITCAGDNKILVANFAVTASHGKPYRKMIGSDLTPLWDADELSRIMRVLTQNRGVRDLEYWSWRWDLQPDGTYSRSKQTLVRHAYLIRFDGVPCRLTLGT